jgi:hypothetical protein
MEPRTTDKKRRREQMFEIYRNKNTVMPSFVGNTSFMGILTSRVYTPFFNTIFHGRKHVMPTIGP